MKLFTAFVLPLHYVPPCYVCVMVRSKTKIIPICIPSGGFSVFFFCCITHSLYPVPTSRRLAALIETGPATPHSYPTSPPPSSLCHTFPSIWRFDYDQARPLTRRRSCRKYYIQIHSSSSKWNGFFHSCEPPRLAVGWCVMNVSVCLSLPLNCSALLSPVIPASSIPFFVCKNLH